MVVNADFLLVNRIQEEEGGSHRLKTASPFSALPHSSSETTLHAVDRDNEKPTISRRSERRQQAHHPANEAPRADPPADVSNSTSVPIPHYGATQIRRTPTPENQRRPITPSQPRPSPLQALFHVVIER